jgi:uncharacterized protein YjbJ (UPF0337 family)
LFSTLTIIILQRTQIMDENRIAGAARDVGGKAKEAVGRATDDTKIQAEGVADQISGAAQELYGNARDGATETATTFEKLLRNTIETQPYTAVAIAIGLGWFLGRLHRPI